MSGLVFFLGDSAVRDDGVPEKRGIFGRITFFDILDAWKKLGLPKPGKDWPKRIRPERKRLKFAFELDQGKREKYREYGYRNPEHFFAILHSVREIRTAEIGIVGVIPLTTSF